MPSHVSVPPTLPHANMPTHVSVTRPTLAWIHANVAPKTHANPLPHGLAWVSHVNVQRVPDGAGRFAFRVFSLTFFVNIYVVPGSSLREVAGRYEFFLTHAAHTALLPMPYAA